MSDFFLNFIRMYIICKNCDLVKAFDGITKIFDNMFKSLDDSDLRSKPNLPLNAKAFSFFTIMLVVCIDVQMCP